MSNNWYVITGGPSSGKTTLLDTLSNAGHITVPEAARVLIDREIQNGLTIAEIRKHEEVFQRKVLELKVELEENLNAESLIFFDRGIPDTEAYMLLHNFEITSELIEATKKCNYRKIFLLDAVPYEQDYARTETEEQRKRLHTLLEDSYKKLGFTIVNVPILPIEERAKFILNNL